MRKREKTVERDALVRAKQILIEQFREAREDGLSDAATYWLGKPNRPTEKFDMLARGLGPRYPGELVYFANDIYDVAFAKGEAKTRAALAEIAAIETAKES